MSKYECYFCGQPGIFSVRGATDAVKRDEIYMCQFCGHAFSFGFGLCVKPIVMMRELETSEAHGEDS